MLGDCIRIQAAGEQLPIVAPIEKMQVMPESIGNGIK
jgi:hypothetical protein